MGSAEDMKRVVQEIVSSYGSRISTVGIIIDNTHQILDDFKNKRNEMSNQLRETLAKEESLRKKDFDNMMKDILYHQDEREKQARDLLRDFLGEQKEMAEAIKDNLAEGERIRIDDFKKMLQDIQVRQNIRENEVTTRLKEFQKEYKEMSESLRSLLNKGETMRIKDFKKMLKDIRSRQIEREEKVRKRLAEFRREQQDMASHWHRLTVIMAKNRADSIIKGGENRGKEEVARV